MSSRVNPYSAFSACQGWICKQRARSDHRGHCCLPVAVTLSVSLTHKASPSQSPLSQVRPGTLSLPLCKIHNGAELEWWLSVRFKPPLVFVNRFLWLFITFLFPYLSVFLSHFSLSLIYLTVIKNNSNKILFTVVNKSFLFDRPTYICGKTQFSGQRLPLHATTLAIQVF